MNQQALSSFMKRLMGDQDLEAAVRKEYEQKGYNGRFGPGLPRVSDGSLLFLLHLISKMRSAADGGSRIGIVLNGSPLFTGEAGSGESEIRRYCLENDVVEAIVGLPTDMFYNTGISTYVGILSNRKPEHRKGRVQLIDASGFWQKMRKSLGSKRKEQSEEHIATVTRIFGDFAEARLAILTDAAGKELERRVLPAGEPVPVYSRGRRRVDKRSASTSTAATLAGGCGAPKRRARSAALCRAPYPPSHT